MSFLVFGKISYDCYTSRIDGLLIFFQATLSQLPRLPSTPARERDRRSELVHMKAEAGANYFNLEEH